MARRRDEVPWLYYPENNSVRVINSHRFGGFSPLQLPGLAAWHKADSLTGLTDGDPVSQWDDSSGNDRHAVQATVSQQPLYRANILNGMPVLRFDGTDYMRSVFGATLIQPTTIFAVARVNNPGRLALDGISSGARHYIFRSTVNWEIGAGVQLKGAIAADDVTHIFSAVFNEATSKLYLDGTLDVTGNAGSHSLTGLTFGATFGFAANMAGDIAEVIVCNSLLTDANRGETESYLSLKYGIS